MKRINFKTYLMFGLLAVAVSLASCKEENPYAGNPDAPVITKIFLADGQSSVPDREVTFARLGQTIRIEGKNLMGIYRVYINGYDSAFNPTLMSNNSMIVRINTRVPVMDADPAARNKVTVAKRNGKEFTFEFEIRASMPSITNVSHTLAQSGERITITGTNMHEAEQVLFPGDIAGTIAAYDEEDGEWVEAIVPEGLTTSGSIKVTGANGTATSAPYFNFKEGVLHNFDDVSNASWASGMDNPIIEADVVLPTSGDGPKSQGRFHTFNSTGNLGSADQRYWLNSTAVETIMNSVIPGNTLTDMCGIQIDIYVEGEWNSGIIRMVVADGMGDTRGSVTYEPIYPAGVVDKTAFVNPGSWFTITMPFSLSVDYGGKTFADVLATMSGNPDWGGKYKQMGPWFDNKAANLPEGAQAAATQKIYFDNVRIVPLEAPAVTDYPEEEAVE